MNRINVTKTFLPPLEEYNEYLTEIWNQGQITNQGPYVKQFEKTIESYLNIKNFHFVNNGTIALQLALRAYDIAGAEVITTPFSYVATTSSIMWEGAKPVFVDIDPKNLCIDAGKIEDAITEKTKAILAVHVFGNPCDVEKIESIAFKHGLKVIYDGAHAFGVTYKDRSLLSYGDISTCSFHATKVFHTIEGGSVVANDEKVSGKIELMKRFGHNSDEHIMLGINAKTTELNAAMGLCNLGHIDSILQDRKRVTETYNRSLDPKYIPNFKRDYTNYNYAYYPILLKNKDELLEKVARLNDINVYPRRYFYPSLNKLPYIEEAVNCPVSEDISSRILCLPLYVGLENADIIRISEVINK